MNTKDGLLKTKKKVLENSFIRMAINTEVNGKIILFREQEYSHGKITINILENSWKVKGMVKVL